MFTQEVGGEGRGREKVRGKGREKEREKGRRGEEGMGEERGER